MFTSGSRGRLGRVCLQTAQDKEDDGDGMDRPVTRAHTVALPVAVQTCLSVSALTGELSARRFDYDR